MAGWDALFLSGSVVDVNVSIWSARVQIKPSDLGIENMEAVSRALSLGHHRLLPKRCFDKINAAAAEAKAAVERASMPFGLIRGARYVPEKNILRLLDSLKTAQAEFMGAVGDFVEEYSAAKNDMLPIIRQAILDAARDTSVVDTAMSRIESEYPTAESVKAHFALKWQVYAIKGPSQKALANEGEAVKDVLREMIKSLRDEVGSDLTKILGLVAKGGKLNARSIESALKTLERVEGLNVLGDTALDAQVGAIRRTLVGLDRSKVNQGDIDGLAEIKESLSSSLDEAVSDAEARLSGVGNRKLEVA